MEHVAKKSAMMKATGDNGEIEITIARYGDVDKDGDVFLPGSIFSSKTNIPVAQYQHSLKLPVGVAQYSGITDEGDVVYKGQIDMENVQGADTFRHIKAMGDDQEYSFRFRSKEYTHNEHGGMNFVKADVYEVSPVMTGSGNHTGTISAKEAKEEETIEGPSPLSMALAILWEI